MAAVNLRIDPSGTVLNLGDRAAGWRITGIEAPTPDLDSQWASSADTEGARRASTHPVNRTITAQIMIEKTTDALLEAEENKLGQKVGKLQREGGDLEMTVPSGTVLTFSVEEANFRRQWDPASAVMHRAFYEVTFICEPYGVVAEADLGDNTETTLPVLVFSDTVPGDVEAYGRVVIDDDSGNDQWFVVWGVENNAEYTHTTSSGAGALFYEAESRTALGGAAATAVAGASGGTVVRQGTLTAGYQAMLSTQASGGGAHLAHVGQFNVFARIQMPTTNTGAVSVAFEYAQGDFRNKSTVGEVTFDANHAREGQWIFQRLGQINIQKVATGTHRWEGRIIAKSTVAGDDLDVDWIGFWPTKVYGEASGIVVADTPTSFSARDEFDQSAGALTGKTAAVGGTWAGAGDADDFTVETTGKTAQRTATLDGSFASGRYAVSGVSAFAAQAVQVDFKQSGNDPNTYSGVLARYAATTDAFYAITSINPAQVTGANLLIAQRVSGATTTFVDVDLSLAFDTWYTIRALVDAAGRWFVWLTTAGSRMGAPQWEGHSTALATGGGLATGKPGFYDQGGAQASTRNYDNFAAWAPIGDAAVFASQSLELRHDSVLREDSTGTYWNRVSSTPGDYLRLPPTGQEGRSTRMIMKLCRNNPDTMVDTAIDDLSARQHATARFLAIPD